MKGALAQHEQQQLLARRASTRHDSNPWLATGEHVRVSLVHLHEAQRLPVQQDAEERVSLELALGVFCVTLTQEVLG